MQLQRGVAKAEHRAAQMFVQRRVHSATAGVQLQRLQPGLPGESRDQVLRMPAVLLPVHERNVVLAGRTFMSLHQQLAAEREVVWMLQDLRRNRLHTKQFEENQLVRVVWHFASRNLCDSKHSRAVDGGIPFTQKSSFRYEILAPRLRLRRDVLFSYEDLIVSFGGVAALFLGYNFWGTSEMFYFLIKSVTTFVIERIIRR